MDDRDLPSDSDSSDEDFVPEGADSDLPSEEESGPEDAEIEAGAGSGDEEAGPKGRKRPTKAKGGSKRKRTKKNSVREVVEEIKSEEDKVLAAEEKKLTEEEEKKKADSLWADFMKDVGPIKKPTASSTTGKSESSVTPSSSVKTPLSKPATEKENKVENKVTVTKIFDFAGEKVEVTKEVAADSPEARLSQPGIGGPSRGGATPRGRGGGLSAVLSQIGKKSKISTLEKSKLDWERFKTDQGLQEEIQTHNRGKDGYLERQDFLQRTDLRQFEIEKQLRANRRSNR